MEAVQLHDKNGDIVNPGESHTTRDPWEIFGGEGVLATGAEPTDLGVTERTYLTVLAAIAADSSGDGKIRVQLLHENPGWDRLKFRATGVTDNGTSTWQIYAGTLGRAPVEGVTDCVLVKIGQLAFVVGTQASLTSGYELADAVTVTEGFSAPNAWSTASPGSEGVAETEIDLRGADVVIAVPTVITNDAQLLVSGYGS